MAESNLDQVSDENLPVVEMEEVKPLKNEVAQVIADPNMPDLENEELDDIIYVPDQDRTSGSSETSSSSSSCDPPTSTSSSSSGMSDLEEIENLPKDLNNQNNVIEVYSSFNEDADLLPESGYETFDSVSNVSSTMMIYRLKIIFSDY